MTLVLFVDHQVLKQDDKPAFGCADRKEQINHAHDDPVTSQHKNTATAGLFENQAQTAKLFLFVRAKITFLGKQFAEHLRQFVQVGLCRRFDYNICAHGWHRLSKNWRRWQSANEGPTIRSRCSIDNAAPIPTVTALKTRRNYFSVL